MDPRALRSSCLHFLACDNLWNCFASGFRYNTKRIRANQVYQEYIQDKHHIHMNATQWATLTEFVKYLGKEGIVRVDENEKGFWISWIDNSPGALARQVHCRRVASQSTHPHAK